MPADLLRLAKDVKLSKLEIRECNRVVHKGSATKNWRISKIVAKHFPAETSALNYDDAKQLHHTRLLDAPVKKIMPIWTIQNGSPCTILL